MRSTLNCWPSILEASAVIFFGRPLLFSKWYIREIMAVRTPWFQKCNKPWRCCSFSNTGDVLIRIVYNTEATWYTNVYVYYAFYVTRFDTKLEELRVFLLCQFFCKNFCNTLYIKWYSDFAILRSPSQKKFFPLLNSLSIIVNLHTFDFFKIPIDDVILPEKDIIII